MERNMTPESPLDSLRDDNTLSPELVEKMAQEPVSHLWAMERCQTCPTTRTVRRWNLVACLLLGALLAVNVTGWVYIKSAVRQAIDDALSVDIKAAAAKTNVSMMLGTANAAERQ